MTVIKKSFNLSNGKTITLETGRLARQADGAVLLTCGETILLATVVARKEIDLEKDFLPLSVEYREKYSSTGKFPGGFYKREGKLDDEEVLVCRLIDRALRPMFPSDYHGDTQVMVQLLSSDRMEQPDALACLAASAAICVSDIPFPDPVSEVRVIRKNGEFFINPSFADMEGSDLDLMVAGTADSIVMVEGEMREVSEEVMLEALKFAHKAIAELNGFQEEMRQAVGKETREYERLELLEDLYKEIEDMAADKIEEISRSANAKENRSELIGDLKSQVKEAITEKYGEEVEYLSSRINAYFKKVQKSVVRRLIVKENLRLDGRALDEVRDIWCEAGSLPRVHGSSLFTRGETQSVCTVTLGTKLDTQKVDMPTYEREKKFMLHYTFPGFSTGEVRPNRGPGRREIGHGNLAERSLKVVIPEDNAYTIRITSDILESNGSSSMASVCGGALALMDAGIKIKAPVSGIAMGLITEPDGSFAVLSDILGDEDFLGDMDFKVAGTTNGLTACQMDIKIRGLSYEIIETALEQSKAGRAYILDKMLEVLPAVREDLSPYAPRFEKIEVPLSMFGMVIGPGGKVIQEIQETTGTTIVLEEGDGIGHAYISSSNLEGIDGAISRIKGIIQMPEVGETYIAKVKNITNYGAFVEFLPGKEGLLHISEISYERIPSMDGVFEVGDEFPIKLIGIDPKSGKFRLSKKALMERPEGMEEDDRGRGRDNRRGGGDRRGGGNRRR